MIPTRTILVAAAALLAVTGGIAIAHDGGRGSDRGERMERGGGERAAMFQRRGAQMFDRTLETFDADGDGSITQDEVNATRAERLAEFDADGNGALSIEEFEALWLDAMRERMVDRFQAHDDDGDGAVTVEEFSEEFSRLVARRDRTGDGVLSIDDVRRPGRPAPEAEAEAE
ncbi:MAG: calcium-binding protein [Pseudomonadota bacterium]